MASGFESSLIGGDFCVECFGVFHSFGIQLGEFQSSACRRAGEMIALMHYELSEALEYLRHGNPPSDHITAHSGAAEEMADCVIRIMDMGLARGWNVADAIIDKIRFNAEREYKHGGKKF